MVTMRCLILRAANLWIFNIINLTVFKKKKKQLNNLESWASNSIKKEKDVDK